MELEDFYPSADDLVQHEVAVLDFLRNDPYIKEKHSQFAQDAATYFGRNKSIQTGFEFFSYLDVSHDQNWKAKPNLRLILAARIERQAKAYANVTYCLCVCRTRNFAVLRKFHFDVTFTAGRGRRRQPHPRCHMQYCGDMIPQMQQMGVRQTQLTPLNPGLSEPRIFTWPMSLALLLDLTLHEFPSPKSEKFRAAPEWKAIIRTHEALILRPFLEKCVEVMKDRDGSRATLGDAFYVG
jgi:hypothetical protein